MIEKEDVIDQGWEKEWLALQIVKWVIKELLYKIRRNIKVMLDQNLCLRHQEMVEQNFRGSNLKIKGLKNVFIYT